MLLAQFTPSLPGVSHADDDTAITFPLLDNTTVRLASVEEGARIMVAKDPFTQSLSLFDLQVRLQRAENATLAEWSKFASAEIIGWTEADAAAIKPIITTLQQKLRGFRLPLPETILLVRTTGKEEAEAAYTRANAIFLPSKVLRFPPEQLEGLVAHEIFHVLSRHSPETRAALYGIIGFKGCAEIPLPASLKDRKITNPDAPLIDCYIELTRNGKQVFAAPILFSQAAKYDPEKKATLFQLFTFRLMLIEKREGAWMPVMEGEHAVAMDPRQFPTFFDQIGKNTQYIIHPDEILADNFVHLVKDSKNLASPKIVERMRSILSP